jgi:polyisoprenoid-binding protein YceI
MRLRAMAFSILCSITGAYAGAATFVPDSFHTFVRFSYQHMGLSTQQSRFDKTTGHVTYDAEAKLATVDIVIDTTSVDTGSDLFNKEIQAARMLDTKRFPTAEFKSTHVVFHGDSPAKIEGQLTLKGITRPVTLIITSFHQGLNWQKKDAIGADATATINRSDFNMSEYVPTVSDEVILSIAIEAVAG